MDQLREAADRAAEAAAEFARIATEISANAPEAAEDIHRRQYDPEETKDPGGPGGARIKIRSGRDQRADDDHRRDGVGHRHQRRVQRRRHRPHHVIADEHREHEDRQPEHEGVYRFHVAILSII
jgi:hypothetical protein